MAIYDINGLPVSVAYDINGLPVSVAYDINGNVAFAGDIPDADYTDYSYVQKWASKGISYSQGFDIYDDKVFWISKSGDASIPSNCYVWNLSDGSQALNDAYITVYSGHGNNLDFSGYPNIYATPAYQPSRVYINTITDAYVATLSKTLTLDDGSTDCDACLDEHDKTILWTLGHTADSSDRSAPFLVSKWDLTHLRDNGDGTYTPELLQSVSVAQPSNSYFFQGCRFHDGYLWFASGRGSGESAYVYAVDCTDGIVSYAIDLDTTSEPEGVSWVYDSTINRYVMYVGFQGMLMRKYIFKDIGTS